MSIFSMYNVFLFLPPIAIIMAIMIIAGTIAEPSNWSSDPNASVSDIESRTVNRGTFVSVVSAIILAIVGGIMAYFKVPKTMIVTNYGFLLGPVIGYMLDIGIGTDDGFGLSTDMSNWIPYVFQSLISAKFLRYVITVLLDLFISDPIQDVLGEIIEPTKKEMENSKNWYANLVAGNLPSIIQSIVGFITFNAYTNQTRFFWAYPSDDLPVEDRMSPFVVSLATAIAGCLYITHNQNSDDVSTKMFYVILAIGLLYAMNQFEIDQAPTESEEWEKNDTEFGMGVVLFVCFVLYGLIWPLLNAGTGSALKTLEKDAEEVFKVARDDIAGVYNTVGNEFKSLYKDAQF